mmetsp:Transcript_13037/g.32181  ORF Transcript_13037/g.32181 Transcript_13037/m.32181 type:complete len:242 (+) Transcript_13037:669-1394(+)
MTRPGELDFVPAAPLGRRPGRLTETAGAQCPRRPRMCAADPSPASPDELVRGWGRARSLQSNITRNDHVSILFLCHGCFRALYAEKRFAQCAERRGISRKVLCLSAGLDCTAGSSLPPRLVAAAAARGIDMAEQKPCAAFSAVADGETFDFIVAMDCGVRERLLGIYERHCWAEGDDYAALERKVRLALDFGNARSMRQKSQWNLSIPALQDGSPEYTMDAIDRACEAMAAELAVACAGLQ